MKELCYIHLMLSLFILKLKGTLWSLLQNKQSGFISVMFMFSAAAFCGHISIRRTVWGLIQNICSGGKLLRVPLRNHICIKLLKTKHCYMFKCNKKNISFMCDFLLSMAFYSKALRRLNMIDCI